MVKVKVLQAFNHKGKSHKAGDVVSLSPAAAKLYTGIDHVEEVKEAPIKASKKK